MDEKELKEQFTHVEGKVEELSDKVTLILQAITGNPLTHDGGIVKDMKDQNERLKGIEKRLEAVEDFKNTLSAKITTIVFICGALGTAIGILLSFFKK